MSVRDVLSSAPYFTNSDPTKNYIQVAFKPGLPVQTRELNELQLVLQDQITQFGSHIFANGSKVTGGDVTTKQVTFYRLESTYASLPVNLEDWNGKTVFSIDSLGNQIGTAGTVVAYSDAYGTDAPTIYVSFDGAATSGPFKPGDQIRVKDTGITGRVISDETTHTGNALYFAINEGVFFLDGYFVHIDPQVIIPVKYTNRFNGYIGLEYKPEPITYKEDQDLLDSAPKGVKNSNAPGADRIHMLVGLRYYDPATDDVPGNFAKIAEFVNGTLKAEEKLPVYSNIGDEFARRTFDESGSYTVTPFKLAMQDNQGVKLLSITHSGTVLAHKATARSAIAHTVKVGDKIEVTGVTGADASIYNGRFTVDSVADNFTFSWSLRGVPGSDAVGDSIVVSRSDYLTAEISPGKAYVLGYEFETIAPYFVDIPRARTTSVYENYTLTPILGNFVVGALNGRFDDFVTASLVDAGNSTIGTARTRAVRLHSGVPGSGAARFRVYLYDINLTTATKSFKDVRKIVGPVGVLTCDIESGSVNLKGQDNGLIIKLPQSYAKTLAPNGVLDTNYTTTQRFQGPVSGSTRTVTFGITGDQYFVGPSQSEFSGSDVFAQNYICTNTADGTILMPTSAIIDASGKQITMTFATGNITVACSAAVQMARKAPRTKSLATNAVNVTYQSATSRYSLGYVDVIEILSIKDPQGNEYKSNFTLDDGQNDNFYDFSSIVGSVAVPNGTLLTVTLRRFDHSGDGYFSVDSYAGIDIEDIPFYKSPRTGMGYKMSDVLDFRPVRDQAGGAVHLHGTVPVPNSLIQADIEFYLPRRDRVAIDRYGQFIVIQGTPSLIPMLPAEPNNAMTLYELSLKPYTADPIADVNIKFIENKRYTMRDIGRIEKRVDRLEYYTQLSLLEMKTRAADVVDTNGLDRFKNGILVDNFTGHKIGDVYNGDYACSIDPQNAELRAPFVSANVRMNYAVDSTSVNQIGDESTGYFLTLPYTDVPFFTNDLASKAESVNPYLVIDYRGSIACVPPSDDWMDTTRLPAINVDLTGDYDAWQYMINTINQQSPGFGTQWNDWQTTWSGITTTGGRIEEVFDLGWAGIVQQFTDTTRTVQQDTQVRTGTQTTLGVTNNTTSLGDKLVDVNLSYWMRAVDVAFVARGLRPNTNLHAFIDKTKVNANIVPNTGYTPTTEGCVRTDANGVAMGVLKIPGGQFRTGERIIQFIDEPNAVQENATTYASYVFASSGLLKTAQDTIVSTRTPTFTTAALTETRTVETVIGQVEDHVTWLHNGQVFDPLAQTFTIPSSVFPYGLFASNLHLYFRRKPDAADAPPVYIQIRPTVNGYPHASKILPMSTVYKQVGDVNIPTRTDDIVEIRKARSTFKFPVPVYLEPGVEYSVIVLSNSSEYELYIAEMGEEVFGTNSIIAGQPLAGSLFKSQNGGTWTASQNEDLMMQLDRAKFDTSATAVAVFRNVYTSGDTRANTMSHNNAVLDFSPVATVAHAYKIKDVATNTMPANWSVFTPGVNVDFPVEKKVAAANDFLIQATLTTSLDSVAPLYDLSRNSVVFINNIINNDFANENKAGGGNAKARYITRSVTLTEDWETDFIKVTADLYRPYGTDVLFYVKSLSPDDPSAFDSRPWVPMASADSKQIYSGAVGDFIESSFVPSNGTLAYMSGGINFKTAKTYAIKIVMLSNNTSVVPKVRDLRAISAAP